MTHHPHVPQDIGELLDQLAYMRLASPKFEDQTGYLPGRNIDTAFLGLNEGLLVVRKELGEERYATLKALSDKMRALFESDTDDMTGDARAGRRLIRDTEDVLKSTAKERRLK